MASILSADGPVQVETGTDDVNIQKVNPLMPPVILMENIPITEKGALTVKTARKDFINIMSGVDDRVVVIVGPCSIHDPEAAMEYAKLLAPVIEEHRKDLLIIMRVYFEKPRTTIGWKGLINDPLLDGTFKINHGLRLARTLLVDLNDMGIPCGTEFLDVISPQFVGDLVAWGAIGARTTESQVHRELASGLSCPVGFKNGTSGDLNVCVGAISSASAPHRFLSVTKQGLAGIVTTKGNKGCHTILRGGTVTGPNFDVASVAMAVAVLKRGKTFSGVIIDCSHGNSAKLDTNQPIVNDSVAHQIANGNKSIMGVMIESNLNSGSQKLPSPERLSELKYGVSITDKCVNWESTLSMISQLAQASRSRREGKITRVYQAKL